MGRSPPQRAHPGARRGRRAVALRARRACTHPPTSAPTCHPARAVADLERIDRLLAVRRRADDGDEPRRRRAGRRVAVPRVPPGRAGGAVRPAPAARPPRPRRARRAAVDVRARRGTGAPLRHRRAGPARDRRRDQAGRAPVDVRGADGRRGRGRRVQPPRVAGRSHRPRGQRGAGLRASTCARSGSRSASGTSRTRSSRLPHVASSLVELFESRFDPALERPRGGAASRRAGRLAIDLDAIQLLDDDRICRAFLTLIDATVRTNCYREKPTLSFKLDPAAIPDLPLPRPMFEIWVCSPRVEGVHLRGGPIARGGIRWSDRREDFRTEVLGLMKAQMVKNAVIVPIGRQGRLRRQEPAGRPGRAAPRGRRVLPRVHPRAARPHRQPRRRRASCIRPTR